VVTEYVSTALLLDPRTASVKMQPMAYNTPAMIRDVCRFDTPATPTVTSLQKSKSTRGAGVAAWMNLGAERVHVTTASKSTPERNKAVHMYALHTDSILACCSVSAITTYRVAAQNACCWLQGPRIVLRRFAVHSSQQQLLFLQHALAMQKQGRHRPQQ
jgi:hypothetical protein